MLGSVTNLLEQVLKDDSRATHIQVQTYEEQFQIPLKTINRMQIQILLTTVSNFL